jgi:hypothetical protein
MKYGFYQDSDPYTWKQYPFRCPPWKPMPDGKKNVVILGCSHTWGVGLEANETWAHHVSQHNTDHLRYWNLGQPGASPETCVRILYSTEKTLDPRIIIVMWPEISRRERLHDIPENIMGTHETLRYENDKTDMNVFLKSVFFLEKYAEHHDCKTFHCFAETYIDFRTKKERPKLLEEYTLRNCWPHWDKFTARELHTKPVRARDGLHFGIPHHERFAKLFLDYFGQKLK